MDISLVSLFLPDGLLDHFVVVKTENSESLTIYLEEKNSPPQGDNEDKFTSKGFYDSITIQDFPIRRKACYLHIRRRKWINERTGNLVNNNWKLAAKGTRMTKELADFLKGANR